MRGKHNKSTFFLKHNFLQKSNKFFFICPFSFSSASKQYYFGQSTSYLHNKKLKKQKSPKKKFEKVDKVDKVDRVDVLELTSEEDNQILAMFDMETEIEKSKLSKQTTENDNSLMENKKVEAPSSPSVLSKKFNFSETHEKRQRSSLLDCLDQNYYNEMPSKIKRESTPILTSNVKCSESPSNDENACKTSDSSSKAIEENCSENEQCLSDQTDKLESLHVISEPNSEEVDSQIDVIPSSQEIHKGPKTITDFFKRS